MNGPAGPAAIARSADADDTKPGRHMIEHLADSLANRMQRATAARAGLLSEIDPHLLAGQVRRDAGPLGLQLRGTWRFGCYRRQRGFDPRNIGTEVFEAELQLAVVQPFSPPAKLAALQIFDDEMKPLDLGLCCGEGGALGRKRVHHPLQRRYIVRQCCKIDVHDRETS